MVLIIVFGVIGFGIMVFVHELGHFLAAKRVGIQVETFSLGWGRKLVGFDYKGTNYRISMIPFGGYCRMKGEDPFRAEEADGKGGFFAAAPWKRIVVSAAGPTANVLFAVLVLTMIWWIGFKTYTESNRIVLASEYPLSGIQGETPASRAGLQTGDRITAVDGKTIQRRCWRDGAWGEWRDLKAEDVGYFADHLEYRIKPDEPREFWLNVYDNAISLCAHQSEKHAAEHLLDGGRTIKVREVLDE